MGCLLYVVVNAIQYCTLNGGIVHKKISIVLHHNDCDHSALYTSGWVGGWGEIVEFGGAILN